MKRQRPIRRNAEESQTELRRTGRKREKQRNDNGDGRMATLADALYDIVAMVSSNIDMYIFALD